tara:strand:- start:104 stop:775 length:672 start_codon:yes stop_codon:yes gene_type:complete
MIEVFTSYHHDNDQYYKNGLCRWAEENGIFLDRSVKLDEISERLSNETIRRIIRDRYLRDTTVTLLLVGKETRFRKHIDWELKSSMIDGAVNKRSGIVVVLLPEVDRGNVFVSDWRETELLYPHLSGWSVLPSRTDYERMFPEVPARIIDNLIKDKNLISITSWANIENNPAGFRFLIENAHYSRHEKEYCLKRPMRRANHNPTTILTGLGRIDQPRNALSGR